MLLTQPRQSTEVSFASFLSGEFITAIAVNSPVRKLSKCTSAQCLGHFSSHPLSHFQRAVPLVLFIYFSGVYTCVAATDTGSDTDSGTLKVTGMPAELLQGPSDVTVLEGTDIQILCTVKGYPLPTHKWYKVNKDSGVFNKLCCTFRYILK